MLLGLTLVVAFVFSLGIRLGQPYDEKITPYSNTLLGHVCSSICLAPKYVFDLLIGNVQELWSLTDTQVMFNQAYNIMVGILVLVLLPLTATALFSMLGGLRELFALSIIMLHPHSILYIFSNINEDSLQLAINILEKEKENKQIHIVFLRYDDSRDNLPEEWKRRVKATKYAMYPGDEIQFLHSNSQSILYKIGIKLGFNKQENGLTWSFFFMSKQSSQNFSQAEHFLFSKEHNFNLFKKLDLFVVGDEYSSELMIDGLRHKLLDDKKSLNQKKCEYEAVDIHLIQPSRASADALLWNVPPLSNGDDGEILVLGAGYGGRILFRRLISQTTMMGRKVKFNVWDKDVEQCIAELRKECPNWDDDISCNTESVDVCSEQFNFLMDQYGRAFLYIVVSLGDDELSMQTAISLCRYYRQEKWKSKAKYMKSAEPKICVRIRDDTKGRLLDGLASLPQWYKNLYIFGNHSAVYSPEVLFPDTIWAEARKIHEEFYPNRYCWSEYERRSSLAAVYHTVCHIRSVLIALHPNDSDDEISKEELEEYKNWIRDPQNLRRLTAAEHQRWENYVRCEGMQHADPKVTRKIWENTNRHMDSFARLSPCVIDKRTVQGDESERCEQKLQQLEQLYDQFYHGSKTQRSFVERDQYIVCNAAEIYSKMRKINNVG